MTLTKTEAIKSFQHFTKNNYLSNRQYWKRKVERFLAESKHFYSEKNDENSGS